MKKMKSMVSLLCTLAIVLTAMLSNASAALTTEGGESRNPSEDVSVSEHFQPITREEYIAEKALHNGISYEEAEASLDENIENALAALPFPADWESHQTVPNGDSTWTDYGRVVKIYTHKSGLQAIYSVNAVLVGSHYGANWVECDSTGVARAYGSGEYTFDGTCTARITTTTTILMSMEGVFEITKEYAINSDVDLSGFTFGTGVTGTEYYRTNVSDRHIEHTRLSN